MKYIFKQSAMTFKKYCLNRSGQFAIWLGVAAFPMLTAISFAVDMNKSDAIKTELKASLDSAALAAVSNQTLTSAGRAEYAKSFFMNNFSHAESFSLVVNSSSAERVDLTANGATRVTIARAMGVKAIDLKAHSVAVMTQEDPICILALDPDGENAFSVSGGSAFSAPTCAVQVNSINQLAASIERGSKASAKSFCVSGGGTGQFFPFINTECRVVGDPFARMDAPLPGSCVFDKKLEFKVEKTLDITKYGNLFKDELVAIVGDMVTLKPGTYCEKLKIEGYNVTFLPGTYIMNNAGLEFKKGASAEAIGVTFVMHGKDSKVKIESGSSLKVVAPKEGNFAGMAFYQNAEAAMTDKKGKIKSKLPTATSELKGGSSMLITGTIYLPTQEVKIGSDSGMGTHAPATSFIGYRVAFEGGSEIEIAVDNVAEGLPPLVPLSDNSARLVK